MTKNIIVVLALLVVSAIFIASSNTFKTGSDTLRRDISHYFPSLSLPSLTIPGEKERALSLEAWTIFENYLEFARTHNLSGLRSLSHQISATCNDLSKENECFALMDSVYTFANLFKLNDFKYILFDERQIIMYTDGPTVAMLYFTRSEKDIKVLGMRFCLEDEKTVGTCVVPEEVKLDLDNNGWWDSVESIFYK